MPDDTRLLRIAAVLERAVLAAALAGIAFRVAVYAHLPKAAGARFGTGDLIDFALLLLLFMLSSACGACGVALALARRGADPGPAWRPLLVGVTTFVVYYLVQPALPALG